MAEKNPFEGHFAAGVASGSGASNSYNADEAPPPAGSGNFSGGAPEMPYTSSLDEFRHEVLAAQSRPVVEPPSSDVPEPDR